MEVVGLPFSDLVWRERIRRMVWRAGSSLARIVAKERTEVSKKTVWISRISA